MEIIASVDQSTRLVKVTTTELLLLQGFNSRYDNGFNNTMIDIGHKIDIAQFAKVSSYVKNMNTSILKQMRKNLETASDEVEACARLVDEINCFDTLRTEP